jgi:peptidoglycan/LPS O-acetylase OafA/YrhL
MRAAQGSAAQALTDAREAQETFRKTCAAALYAMVVLTAIPSFHYLLTSERQEFFRSATAVLTFTSNFFFWFQTGYFDHAAVEKPLLHTWSLAVEEQFYLALPIVLWALLRFARNVARRCAHCWRWHRSLASG